METLFFFSTQFLHIYARNTTTHHSSVQELNWHIFWSVLDFNRLPFSLNYATAVIASNFLSSKPNAWRVQYSCRTWNSLSPHLLDVGFVSILSSWSRWPDVQRWGSKKGLNFSIMFSIFSSTAYQFIVCVTQWNTVNVFKERLHKGMCHYPRLWDSLCTAVV